MTGMFSLHIRYKFPMFASSNYFGYVHVLRPRFSLLRLYSSTGGINFHAL